MKTPTDFDRSLLRLIVQLTDENGGRPPTLAELAIAGGLQENSRSYIQRQLKMLRPTYVQWTSTARSLRVTPAGFILLDSAGPETHLEAPIAEVVLPLLASGLTQMDWLLTEHHILQAPYPDAWQRGLNILAAECLLRGVTPPAHTAEAIAWCHLPLSQWPIKFAEQFRTLDVPLLEDEEPTIFCRELAIPKREAEQEWCENQIEQVREEAQQQGEPSAYVAIRRYLIEHSVVSETELLTASFATAMGSLGHQLDLFYEEVPLSVTDDGKVRLCGFCGWTLQRIRGRLRCGDDRCRTLTADFTRGTVEINKPETHLMRVRSPIRRYIVAPGKSEVSAATQLARMGIEVELWPRYDQYDLRLTFPNGEVWAADVKDWRYPHLLVRHLRPLQSERAPFTRAFYIVPDHRIHDNPDYLKVLQGAIASQPFEVVALSQFVRAAQDFMEANHA